MNVRASVMGPQTRAISGRDGNSEEYVAWSRYRAITGFAWMSGSEKADWAVGMSFVPGAVPSPRAKIFCCSGLVMNFMNSKGSCFTGLGFQIADPLTPRAG